MLPISVTNLKLQASKKGIHTRHFREKHFETTNGIAQGLDKNVLHGINIKPGKWYIEFFFFFCSFQALKFDSFHF